MFLNIKCFLCAENANDEKANRFAMNKPDFSFEHARASAEKFAGGGEGGNGKKTEK